MPIGRMVEYLEELTIFALGLGNVYRPLYNACKIWRPYMANVAVEEKKESCDERSAELSDLFIEALLGAKTGDLGAAEDFADELINIFQSSSLEQLASLDEDDDTLELSSGLGVLEGLGIRGAL